MYGALRVMVPILALTASLGAISPQTFRAQSDLVVLQAAVSGRSGAVSDLERQDFRLYEDGKPQEIRFFLNEDHPVAAGLVVDNSLSMRNKRAELIAAADAFALSSHPDDALFTVNFTTRWLEFSRAARPRCTMRLPRGWIT